MTTPFDPGKMSWGHRWYDLPFIWNDLGTRGRNVTVAVIDTGVDSEHPDLEAAIHPLSRSFTGDAKNFRDSDGHGTKMAGMIGAGGVSKVFGVAPDIRMVILKASEKSGGAAAGTFAQALDFASTVAEIDIISVSNVLADTPGLRASVTKCISAGKILFAAIGNERDLDLPVTSPDPDTFPACYENVNAVGAFNSTGTVCSFSNYNGHLGFLAPGDEEMLTAGPGGTAVREGGTSIAAAFAAGSFGLMLSWAKMHGKNTQNCLDALLNSCDDIGNAIGKDIQSGYGRMNLRNAISKIKNA